jgi:hypothetical protein
MYQSAGSELLRKLRCLSIADLKHLVSLGQIWHNDLLGSEWLERPVNPRQNEIVSEALVQFAVD